MKPMLCVDPEGGKVPTGPGWVIEPKVDGWRFLFEITDQEVRSYAGRNGTDRTGQPAEIEGALFEHMPQGTILDGELWAPGAEFAAGSSEVSHRLASGGLLKLTVFDVLKVLGRDVKRKPWWERRALLEELFQPVDDSDPRLMLSPVVPADQVVHQGWLDAGFEGSVAKRTDSIYVEGARSRDWPKVKPQSTAEAVVVGFKAGKGSRAGGVGALRIRMLTDRGPGVETTCSATTEQMRDPGPWLHRTIEIAHNGIRADSGKPRHPVFLRERPDREEVA